MIKEYWWNKYRKRYEDDLQKYYKEREKKTVLKDQIQLLQKEVRFLKSKKYIKLTATQILKDKGHTKAQAKFLIRVTTHKN